MDCSKAAELFSGYIDNMLDDDEAAMLKEHMDTCATCRQEYEALKTMVDKCRKLEETDLPVDFERDLHERLLSEKMKLKRGVAFFIKRYRAVAAAFLIFALSVSIAATMGLFEGSRNKSGTIAESLRANDLKSAGEMAEESGTADENPQTAEIPSQKEGNNDNKIMMFSAPADPEKREGANAMSENLSYDVVNVYISKAAYDKCSQYIASLIESMGGQLISQQPLQYTIPEGYADEFINKMKDDLKTEDIVVSTEGASEENDNLKFEKNTAGGGQNGSDGREMSGSEGKEDDLKKPLSPQKAAESTIIQININQ